MVETKVCGSAIGVHSEPEFDFLSDEYQRLFAATQATAFQSPHWLHNFYKYIPQSVSAEPLILTVRSIIDQSLLMVLPMVRQRALGAKIVQPADLGISDYNAILAAPETLKRLTHSYELQAELTQAMEPYDILLFRKQRPDTTNIQDVLSGTKVSARKNTAFAIEIPEDFEAWLKTCLKSKNVSNLRRKGRAFNRDVGELEFSTLTEPDEITAAFDFIRKSRGDRYEGDVLKCDAYFGFYLDFAIQTAAENLSVTHVGRVNGEIVSAEFGPIHNGCCSMVLAAFNETDYARYSIGSLSMIDLFQDRHKRGERCIDFTIGEHEYKRRFKAEATVLNTITLPNSAIGKLTDMAYTQGGQLKHILKKLSPHFH